MTEPVHEDVAGKSPLQQQLDRQIAELEQRHRIGPDKYCGMTPAEISRAVIACHSGPRRPGEPVGCWPAGSEEIRTEWLRAEYGPAADVERLRAIVQFFEHRLSQALQVDWQLPNAEFDSAVAAGLSRHYPELTDDVRRVIAGNFSYTHAR